jgi:ribosomal protein L33
MIILFHRRFGNRSYHLIKKSKYGKNYQKYKNNQSQISLLEIMKFQKQI